MPVTGDELRAMNGVPIWQTMDKKGITDDMLMDILKEELAAVENKVFHNKDATEGNKVIYSKDLIAHEPRLRALELSCKLRGHLVERKHHTFEKPIPVQLTEEKELEVKVKMKVLKGEKLSNEEIETLKKALDALTDKKEIE